MYTGEVGILFYYTWFFPFFSSGWEVNILLRKTKELKAHLNSKNKTACIFMLNNKKLRWRLKIYVNLNSNDITLSIFEDSQSTFLSPLLFLFASSFFIFLSTLLLISAIFLPFFPPLKNKFAFKFNFFSFFFSFVIFMRKRKIYFNLNFTWKNYADTRCCLSFRRMNIMHRHKFFFCNSVGVKKD